MALVIGRGPGEITVVGVGLPDAIEMEVLEIRPGHVALVELRQAGTEPRRRLVGRWRLRLELRSGWTVNVVRCRHGKASLAFTMPREVEVKRKELVGGGPPPRGAGGPPPVTRSGGQM